MHDIKNKVQLIGYLGQAPEVKVLESGKKVANLNLATHESYQDANGEKVTETQWHSIVAWGKLAEIIGKYLIKGSEIAIEGKLVNRHYVDKKGTKHYISEVQANQMLMLSKKEE